MRKKILYLFTALGLILLSLQFGHQKVPEMLGYHSYAGLKITSTPEAIVFLNGKEVGKTPYQNENLKVEEYQIKLQAQDASWQGNVKLVSGTLSVINRELAPNISSSSGEVLTLTEGKGAMIFSNPTGAEVEIDGKFSGKTPLSVSDLASGEHIFIFSKDLYLKRSLKAYIPDKMTLNINVDLAIAEAGISDMATPKIVTLPKIKILQTPTGFLRLRSQPSITGEEIGQVSPGDTASLLEESGSWVKIRLDNNQEGYVSSQYIEKLP